MHRPPFLFVLRTVLLVFVTKQCVEGASHQRGGLSLCPKDFLRIQNKCYYFSNNAETWLQSYWKCDERNSTLAVLLNKHQSDALRIFLGKGYLVHVNRWLGGQYDWQKMQWKWASNGKVIYYQQFPTNKTVDKSTLKWHCLILDPHIQYRWNSSSCLNKNYYICETKMQKKRTNPDKLNIPIAPPRVNHQGVTPHNNSITHVSDSQPGYYVKVIDADPPTLPPKRKKKNKKKKFICPSHHYLVRKKCYYFSANAVTWQEAFYKCQDIGSELAVLKNLKQDRRLRMSLKRYNISKEQRWLGGRYDWQNLSWKWAASGDVVQQQMHNSEHLRWACIVWDPKLLSKWSSESCLASKHYFCQANAKPLKKMRGRNVSSTPIDVEMEFRINNVTRKRVSY